MPVVFFIENIGGKADLNIYISSIHQEPTQSLCEKKFEYKCLEDKEQLKAVFSASDIKHKKSWQCIYVCFESQYGCQIKVKTLFMEKEVSQAKDMK